MRKIFTIVVFVLIGTVGNVWGAEEYPAGSFVGISESTRNLFEGYIRCGSLMKKLIPTSTTPMLTEIQAISSYSREIEAKVKQVHKFLGSLVDKTVDSFLDECVIANPTLSIPKDRGAIIFQLLRRDLEAWLKDHEMFLSE